MCGAALNRQCRSSPHKAALEAVRTLTHALGGRALVTHQTGPLAGSAGVPDMLLLFPRLNRAVWMEVKAGRDRLRPPQIAVKALLESCGHEVLVGGVDELIRWHPDAR